MKNLPDVIILSLAVVFLIIGIDQTVVMGFGHGYWAFMLTLVFFFIFTFRKPKK